MREIPLSTCEREFILKAIAERKRIDGREVYDYRRIKVAFGVDRGCCVVEIGKTRVMTQVSCEVAPPKQTRPTEGTVFVNVELSPMAAQHFEAGRLSEYGVEINRLLERCIKESRCVDTESLCIMAGIKVWSIRVDTHILNHEGNLIDACSISAIAALVHFRRPDVTVSGEDVTIHSLEERDPIPLSIHHLPICVTFAFFDQGKYLLVDPTVKEEQVTDGKMIIAMNKHREICTLQMTGRMLLLKDQVLRCSNIAVVKVTEITELIQKALLNDMQARASGEKFGFAVSVVSNKVTACHKEGGSMDVEEVMGTAEEIIKNVTESSNDEEDENETCSSNVKILAPGTCKIGEGGASTWVVSSSDESTSDDDDSSSDDVVVEEVKVPRKQKQTPPPIELSDDGSEEEDVVMLDEGHLQFSHKPSNASATSQRTMDLLASLKTPVNTEKKRAKKGKRKNQGSVFNL